jgi:replicative superfamily II helicase
MIDEVHILGTDRGGILEAIVSRMNVIGSQQSENVRIAALSATIPNISELAEWLNAAVEDRFEYAF